jgi:hypothetical protein
MKADFAGLENFIKTRMSKICNNEYFHGSSGEKNDIKETSNSNHLLFNCLPASLENNTRLVIFLQFIHSKTFGACSEKGNVLRSLF